MKSTRAPAIALIVIGALGVLASLYGFVSPSDTEQLREGFEQSGLSADQVEQMVAYAEKFGTLGNLLGLSIGAFVIFGGTRMLSMKGWGVAVTASILAMLPCWCCCILGIPIGIWSLIVLMDKDVKAAFGASHPPPI